MSTRITSYLARWNTRTTKVVSAIALGGVVFAWGGLQSEPALSQGAGDKAEFLSLPLGDAFKNDRGIREKRKTKDDMLRGAIPFVEANVQEFYRFFLLARLTDRTNPELANEARREILDDMERAEKTGDPVLSSFNDLIFKLLNPVALGVPNRGDFHPSAAINATLILGRLNAAGPTNVAAARPYPRATGALLKLALEGSNDGVRAAAFDGLERHVLLSVPALNEGLRKSLAEKLLESVTAPRTIGRSDGADAWLKGRALELLVMFEHPLTADVYKTAVELLAQDGTHDMLVEKSLFVVGRLAPVDPARSKSDLATAHSLTFMIRKLRDWQAKTQEGTGGGTSFGGGGYGKVEGYGEGYGGAGGYGGGYGGGKPKKEKVVKKNPYAEQKWDAVARRRQGHQILETVRFGLDGDRFGTRNVDPKAGLLPLLSKSPNRVVVEELIPAIIDLQDAINSEKVTDRSTLQQETRKPLEEVIAIAESFPGVESIAEILVDVIPDMNEEMMDEEGIREAGAVAPNAIPAADEDF